MPKVKHNTIDIQWFESPFNSIGVTFTQYDHNLNGAGYNYIFHIKLWKNTLAFLFNTFR